VSELGELLELLHGADAPFETLFARFRIWRHDERTHAAFRAYADSQPGTSIGVLTATRGASPEESEEIISIWREQPDRARMERPGSYGVCVGERWWMWQDQVGAISNADDESVSSSLGDELTALLSPARLLAVLRFEPTGRAERLGRPVIVANAWPRPSPRQGPDGFALDDFGLGAERYRLEIDAERGIILASQSFTGNAPFIEVEALELKLDEPIDQARFEFVPPEGEEVRSSLDLGHSMRSVSIAEAQAAAPFTVLIPQRVPPAWQVRCHYVGEPDRPSVHLHYQSESAHESLNISQGYATDLAPEIDEQGFEEAQAGERRVWVRGRDQHFPQTQLYMDHEDTRILMTSESLTTDQLIALAAMLVPAPDAPSQI
jgi:outer membrane lipoprotein-sorting protein